MRIADPRARQADCAMPKVIVIGGGPIGLTCAALLARRGIASTVLDARALAQARLDARLLALSRGTWDLLAPVLDATPLPRAPIREVLVSSAGDFGATRITAADFGGEDLGATVLYGDLLAALAEAVAARPEIELVRPTTVTAVRQRPDCVEVTLGDGSVRSADLAIHAEGTVDPGGPSPAVDAWALLAEVSLRPARAGAPSGSAFERFTREGPLAVLPTPKPTGSGPGFGYALVWCMGEAQAQRRARLDDSALIAELQQQIGNRLGRIAAIGPRRIAALPRRVRETVHEHRVVAVGNAAQTLHPVAGQGFNLGVRDCASLAEELATGGAATDALLRYAARRRADRTTVAWLTGNLPAIFASRFAPLALARGLGLTALDVVAPLRRQFAQLLMFGVRT